MGEPAFDTLMIAKAANKTVYTLGGLIGALFVIDRLLAVLDG